MLSSTTRQGEDPISGTVGIIADSTGRYTMFTQALISLHSPVNTAVDFRIGADRGRSRNSLVRASLERGSEWICFFDDDHTFPPTLLNQLLSHEEPIVASLYLQRSDPFLPIAYAEKRDSNYWPLDLSSLPAHGLAPVVGAGTGGMLIRSEVFHALPEPWFVHTTEQSEDLYFCDRAVEAGFPIYVDLDARLGHIAAINVFPSYEEDTGWAAGLSVSPAMRVLMPIQMPAEE